MLTAKRENMGAHCTPVPTRWMNARVVEVFGHLLYIKYCTMNYWVQIFCHMYGANCIWVHMGGYRMVYLLVYCGYKWKINHLHDSGLVGLPWGDCPL